MGTQGGARFGAREFLVGPTSRRVVESATPLKKESEGGEGERENRKEKEKTGSERLMGGRRRGSQGSVDSCHWRRERERVSMAFPPPG